MKVFEFLGNAAKTENGITFCVKNQERFVSYTDLWERVLRQAYDLKKKGLRKDDSVILVLPNDIDFVTSFFAIQVIGAIPCAVYPPLRFKKLNEWKEVFEHQIGCTRAKMIIGDERLRPLVQDMSSAKFYSPQDFNFEFELINEHRDVGTFAFIQFSSGTTGLPKPIRVTHEMVAANVVTIRESFPDPEDGRGHRTVSWLPLYHDMGLVGALLTSIYAQVKLVLMRPEDFLVNPMSWLQKITEHQGTVTVAPNFAFGLCVKRFKQMDLDLSSLEVAMCGAEQVHRDTMDKFFKNFSPYGLREEAITPVYGMAEATLAVSFSDLTKAPVYIEFDRESLTAGKNIKAGHGIYLASVGQPLPDTEIEIRDIEKKNLPENTLGEIWVKGPGIYTEDQWMSTGDQGFLYNGQLFLWGRLKDILIVNGKNIDPTYIELACRDIQEIRPGKIVAANDYRDSVNEKIIVFVESGTNDPNGLKKQVIGKILQETGVKVHQVEILKPGDLPRTSSGKIQRSKCMTYYYENQFGKTDRDRLDMAGLIVHSAKIKAKKLIKRAK